MQAIEPRPILTLLLLACAAPAIAVDCTVNALEAHNVAKPRGWTFTCEPAFSNPSGMTFGFVTYPPDGIGCVFKTPPVLPPFLINLGSGRLFSNSSDSLTRPNLKNGWKVKSFEVFGGQWYEANNRPKTQVHFVTKETPKQNRTYNYKLGKLVLTHPTGTCANALNEAF